MARYLIGVILGMLALTAASVPLYQVFCAVTGFGGTTRSAIAAPGGGDELPKVEVAFKVRKSAGTPAWASSAKSAFRCCQSPGSRDTGQPIAREPVPAPTSGTSVFNVTPLKAGKYFSKIQCFCFDEQTLAASEEVDMDLVFFVDPAMFDDPDTRDVRQITLNYTFYPATINRSRAGLGRLRPRFLHVSPGNRTDESRRWELRCGGPSFRRHQPPGCGTPWVLATTTNKAASQMSEAVASHAHDSDHHHGPNHDYHLLDPSIWPLFCSARCSVCLVTAVPLRSEAFSDQSSVHGEPD